MVGDKGSWPPWPGAAPHPNCSAATYEHRIDDPGAYNWCPVPSSGPDAFLFAGLAVVAACLLQATSSMQSVLVLLAGAALEGFVLPFNLGRLGNAVTLWLGISPPDLFFYAFLPPLLVSSALSLDYFMFKKIMLHILAFSFLVVMLGAALVTPFLLYVLRLGDYGWQWQHCALFSSMLASTDALAISSLLRQAGGPESLITLMEGESLLNDASGIVLFELFHKLVREIAQHGDQAGGSPMSVIPTMAADTLRLATGGAAVGLTLGYLTKRLLRWLRWRGATAPQEIAAVQAISFLAFYVANAPLKVSGVIAVVVYGLYGNSTSQFDMGASHSMRDLLAVQQTVSFILNAIVFFFAGASCVNFMVRAFETLRSSWWSITYFPLIYIALFGIRFVSISLFNPMFTLLGAGSLPLKAVAFASWGGLRGAISLIMAQVVVEDETLSQWNELVIAQMGLWTALFVLATLLVNAPTVPALLRAARLLEVSPIKLGVREKAKRALLRYTVAALKDLKEVEDEMLRGVDWTAVARYVDLSAELGTPGAPEPADSIHSDGRHADDYDGPGWMQPASPRKGQREERAAALLDLGRPSPHIEQRHRSLLGRSRQRLDAKWSAGLAGMGNSARISQPADIEAPAEALEEPLLPPSDHPPAALASAQSAPQLDAAITEYGGNGRPLRPASNASDWEEEEGSWPSLHGGGSWAPPGGASPLPGQRPTPFSRLELDTSLQAFPSVASLESGASAPEAGPGAGLAPVRAPPPVLARVSLQGTPRADRSAAARVGDSLSGAAAAVPSSPHPHALGGGSYQPTSVLDLETTELLASLTEEGMADAAGAVPPLPPSSAASPFQQVQLQEGPRYLRQQSDVARHPPHPPPPEERRAPGLGSASPAAIARTLTAKPWQLSAALLRRSMSSPMLARPQASASSQQQQQPPGAAPAPPWEPGAAAGVGSAASVAIEEGGSQPWGGEVQAEARIRLVMSLKRYFHAKRAEGLLSAEGLRLLDHTCDAAIDQAEKPLNVWPLVEREVFGRYTSRALAWLFWRSKQAVGRLPRWSRGVLMPLLRGFSSLIGVHLSRTLLLACEVAVEYWMALTWSPQAQWLRGEGGAVGGAGGPLPGELAAESVRVCGFLIERELEAPERFQAIQSYRAAMAVLRQQTAFVGQLWDGGVVDEAERAALEAPVAQRLTRLELRGPTWRAPSVREVLRALPFLAHVPEPLFLHLLERGRLREYARGEVIWDPGHARGAGMFVVIYGLVRSSFRDHRGGGGGERSVFLGSGGVIGLLSALTAEPLPNAGPALAEANALGKGPVLFHWPQAVVDRLRGAARGGAHDWRQLELDLFRVAALYVVERVKGEAAAELAAHHQRVELEAARRGAIHRAAAAAAAASEEAEERRREAERDPWRGLGGAPAEAEEVEEEEEGMGAEEGEEGGAEGEPPGRRKRRVRWALERDLEEESATGAAEGEARSPHAAAAALHFLPLSDEELLASLDRVRLWRRGQEYARRTLAAVTRALRDAELLALGPGQRWRQRSHAVLLQGWLRTGHGAEGGGVVDEAPSVLPYLNHDQLPGALGNGGGSPAAHNLHAHVHPGILWVAGDAGATLVVCAVPGSHGEAEREGGGAGAGTSPRALRRVPSRRLPAGVAGLETLQPG